MDLMELRNFFKWNLILGAGLFIFWTLWVYFAPNFVYKTQYRWFPIKRETYDIIMYSFLGIYKLMLIFFCAIPYITLLIIG